MPRASFPPLTPSFLPELGDIAEPVAPCAPELIRRSHLVEPKVTQPLSTSEQLRISLERRSYDKRVSKGSPFSVQSKRYVRTKVFDKLIRIAVLVFWTGTHTITKAKTRSATGRRVQPEKPWWISNSDSHVCQKTGRTIMVQFSKVASHVLFSGRCRPLAKAF